eukprot:CAMPEP_0114524776 /NCGR_PEP_ID=MMETSP0109-20121206/22048_1 /TAXON_ID=29199 /ORGANISM="Chlorarachnion reptans, Strain CCCM449" /LENGTH=260 /DNA_ID=CAMNT_0001706267 /DNA_START=37 /DNA_END=819 /DNA_ORIENTATION=+
MQGGFTSPAKSSQFGASQGSPSVNAKRNQSLTPLSIKQLIEAKQPDSMSFSIDDKPVSQVKIVGMILSVDVSAATTNYTVDDGTGQITVRIYTNEDAPQDLNSGCREDVYVKVVGNLRDISGQKIVVAFQVHPVTNFNEITMHHLDVVHTHLKNTKGPLDAKGNLAQKAVPQNPMLANSSAHYDGGNSGENDDMEPHQSAVLKIFQQESRNSESGASITLIVSKLPQYTPAQIRDAIEFLSGEGHLYSTIDEEHYKCTSD